MNTCKHKWVVIIPPNREGLAGKFGEWQLLKCSKCKIERIQQPVRTPIN